MTTHINLQTAGTLCKKALMLLASALVATSLPSFAARGPANENAIKIYPGATVITDENDRSEEGGHIRSSYKMRYSTTVMPEEVYRFYQKQLGAIEQGHGDSEPAPGSTSEVYREVAYHTFQDIMEKGEGQKRRTAIIRANRKPLEQEKWLNVARFNWVKTETNGERTTFKVRIGDSGYDEKGIFYPETQITIERITYKSEQAMADEAEQADEAERTAKVQQLASTSLNPAALGIPEYPGARRDDETSSTLRSSMAIDTVAYRTKDPVQKVASFTKNNAA